LRPGINVTHNTVLITFFPSGGSLSLSGCRRRRHLPFAIRFSGFACGECKAAAFAYGECKGKVTTFAK
jgi:hypothetical protein